MVEGVGLGFGSGCSEVQVGGGARLDAAPLAYSKYVFNFLATSLKLYINLAVWFCIAEGWRKSFPEQGQ